MLVHLLPINAILIYKLFFFWEMLSFTNVLLFYIDIPTRKFLFLFSCIKYYIVTDLIKYFKNKFSLYKTMSCITFCSLYLETHIQTYKW